MSISTLSLRWRKDHKLTLNGLNGSFFVLPCIIMYKRCDWVERVGLHHSTERNAEKWVAQYDAIAL